eukprot:TRINITY_DN16246_c0_g1_i1.p1 TRINITY_DN16246_c0_g1~~TRINITY_DN16246_c0_g1_i1.p1  ORF type:complete len:198 (+),score=15.47 TRINITY_DN16246_c0_g1_i1:61-654(+)
MLREVAVLASLLAVVIMLVGCASETSSKVSGKADTNEPIYGPMHGQTLCPQTYNESQCCAVNDKYMAYFQDGWYDCCGFDNSFSRCFSKASENCAIRNSSYWTMGNGCGMYSIVCQDHKAPACAQAFANAATSFAGDLAATCGAVQTYSECLKNEGCCGAGSSGSIAAAFSEPFNLAVSNYGGSCTGSNAIKNACDA